MTLSHSDIACVFNECFADSHRTILVGGAQEPLFTPASKTEPAKLSYREDFAASALHECAHWCIAGALRRTKVDFGYEYLPPPRTPAQQSSFFSAEVKTQSLEQVFALHAGVKFSPSADNLPANIDCFVSLLAGQHPKTLEWIRTSADQRASTFCLALANAVSAAPAHG